MKMLPKKINNAQLVSETAKVLKEIFLTGRCAKDITINTQDVTIQILDFTIAKKSINESIPHPDAYMATVFKIYWRLQKVY